MKKTVIPLLIVAVMALLVSMPLSARADRYRLSDTQLDAIVAGAVGVQGTALAVGTTAAQATVATKISATTTATSATVGATASAVPAPALVSTTANITLPGGSVTSSVNTVNVPINLTSMSATMGAVTAGKAP